MLLNYYEILSEVQDIDGICVCSFMGFKVYSNMLMFNYHCSKKDLQLYFLFYPQLCHILNFEVSFNYICKYNFFPSFKRCFVNCTSYVCSVLWHNGIQTRSWMSVKRTYTSEDLVIWKKMTSIPKGLRFMLVRTRAGFLCFILIAHLWRIQNSVIWGISGIHKFLRSQHATTTTTTTLTKDIII